MKIELDKSDRVLANALKESHQQGLTGSIPFLQINRLGMTETLACRDFE